MAPVLPADGHPLTHRRIELLQQGRQLVLAQGWFSTPPGGQLSLHHQVAIAANRGGGLHVGRQSQAEVMGRVGAHQPAAEAAFDGRKAHGPLR